MQPSQNQAYDSAITVYSPDGRLFQVEYAREAVKRGNTAVGVTFREGVVLIVDKRIPNRLVEAGSIEKIFKLDDHIACATSGLVADARSLVDRARLEGQINRITYDEPIGVGALVKRICDFIASYTQSGGVRPFGTALLVGGMDEDVPHLYETDPSGALVEYKASSVGAGRNAAMEVFEERFKEGSSQEAAVILGLQALHKATEGKMAADSVEIGVVSTKVNFRKFTMDEVRRHIERAMAPK